MDTISAPGVNNVPFRLPEHFYIAETFDPDVISFGVARSRTDQCARRRLVGQIYTERGYIEQSHSRLLEYVDAYEQFSIPIVAKANGLVIASLRMIHNSTGMTLPILVNPSLEIYQNWRKHVGCADFELSQLAKSSLLRRDSRPLLGIIRVYLALMRYMQSSTSVATADVRVKRLLNGRLMPGAFVEIGPTAHYMGSKSTPVYITPEAVIRCAHQGQVAGLGSFLTYGKSEGFNWYCGP